MLLGQPTPPGSDFLNMFSLKTRAIAFARQSYPTVIRQKSATRQKLGSTTTAKKSWLPTDKYTNPIKTLQPLVSVPLLDPPDGLFEAAADTMHHSDRMFQAEHGHEWRKFKGAIDYRKLEDFNVPEVAFMGRSNVGKSTLVSSLMYHTERIKVSSKPGRTQSLKQFVIGKRLTLLDMPGYGHNMPDHYQASVEEYLVNRKQLHRTFVLVDGKVGMTPLDERALDMMEIIGKPYTLVMTKIDQVSAVSMIENMMRVKELQESRLQCCFPQVFLLSSHADLGVSFLRAFIAEITVFQQERNRQLIS